MYFKLAARNVRKSYKDFLIYFLTLAFSVCLFYIFNSFQDQQTVMKITSSQEEIIQMLASVMTFLSIFVAVVLAFLILYANNFLIKRRKKELGLYMLLGMAKNKISRVLVYETFIIGILSLLFGMLASIFLSQILTSVTANMFEVPLNYEFVFSESATLLTMLSFGIIFFIVMLFNSLVLNRYKLIDLLHAEQVMEKLRVKRISVSIFLFLLSLLFLGLAYHKAISEGVLAFNYLPFIISCGCIGTVLFFMSLAGFLLTIIKTSKHIYLKNLNCFILKQINANINTNFLSMSIVCIMLLLSIGALATGWNMNATINKSIQNVTPFDYSLTSQYVTPLGKDNVSKNTDFDKQLQQLQIDRNSIKEEYITTLYITSLQSSVDDLSQHITNEKNMQMFSSNAEVTPLLVVSESDFNYVMKHLGYDEITLADSETYLYTTMAIFNDSLQEILNAHPTVRFYDKELKITNESFESPSLYTSSNIGYDFMIFVVKDNVIPKDAKTYAKAWNVNLQDAGKSDDFSSTIDQQLKQSDFEKMKMLGRTAEEVKQANIGMSVMFTYVGLYLGIVFMISSALILALQQLSQANENKKHYAILNKIGADQKMLNRSIFLQIGIYFLLPMLLAIIHSIIGIQVVNNLVLMFGKTNILLSSFFTAGIILLIYGSYFVITYLGYKNILRS